MPTIKKSKPPKKRVARSRPNHAHGLAMRSGIFGAIADVYEQTSALEEMVECYGETAGLGPIDIITRAVKAIRLVKPGYKFEDY